MWQHGICIGRPEHIRLSKIMPRAARQLSRNDFEDRVRERLKDRYQVAATGAWIDDLIKDSLVPGADRIAQNGKSPVYAYGVTAYRRVLQVGRASSLGFRSRDALRVHLYLRGYENLTSRVRAALAREWHGHVASLMSGVRSGYLISNRPIPSVHLTAFLRQLGQADAVVTDSGFTMDSSLTADVMRAAVQSSINMEGLLRIMVQLSSGGQLTSESLAKVAPALLSGLLAPEGAAEADGNADHVDGVLSLAQRQDFDRARLFIWHMPLMGSGHLPIHIDGVELVGLLKAIRKSMISSPAWATFTFVLAVMFTRQWRLSQQVPQR